MEAWKKVNENTVCDNQEQCKQIKRNFNIVYVKAVNLDKQCNI